MCELGEDVDEVVVEIRELEKNTNHINFCTPVPRITFTPKLTDGNRDNLLVKAFCLECNGSMRRNHKWVGTRKQWKFRYLVSQIRFQYGTVQKLPNYEQTPFSVVDPDPVVSGALWLGRICIRDRILPI